MRTHLHAASWVCAIALIVAYVLPAAAEPTPRHATEEWLASMEAYYQANPTLQTTPGSGWKPYNRTKWYREQRKIGDRYATAGDLWNAWEAKEQILRERGMLRSGNTWFSVGPANYSGRILDLEFDPTNTDILYVGSASGGLWKSTDHGLSYTPMTDELPSIAIGAVCVLPWDTSIVLVGTGEGANGDVDGVGILKSTDGGVTWNTTDFTRTIVQGHGFHVMEVNPTTQTILAGASDGLWRSTDQGDTWIDVRTGGDHFDVVWKPGDPNTVYTVKGSDSVGNNVKISTDDGLTWTRAGTGQPASAFVGKTKLAVSAAQPTWLYANISNQSGDITNAGIYRTTDDGATWNARYTGPSNIPGGQGWYNLSLAVDPDDANTVIACGVRLYRSTDGAASFSIPIGESNVHVDHHAIAYEPGASNTLWVGSDGGVWRNDSDGNFWASGGDRSVGLVTYQFYDICVNNGGGPYYALGGTQDQGTDKFTGSTSWTNSLGADGMVCMVSPEDGTTVYGEIQNGGTRRNLSSGNPGGWASISFPGTKQWVNPWACGQVDGDVLMGASSSGTYKSTNTGTSWANVGTHVPVWIDFYDLDDDVVWTVVGGTSCYYTTDGGAGWTQTSSYGFSTGSPTKVLAHPSDPATAFVTFSGYGAVAHVAMTTDYGVTWADVSGDLPSQPANAIAVDPDNTSDWYIGTDNAVWLTTNGGVNWLPCDTSLPNVEVHDLEIANGERKLVAGTYGRGMWEMDLDGGGGNAVGEPDVAAARNLMLDSPLPNPAQGRTTLRWAAHFDGAVTLEIYDVQGRRVESLQTLSRGDGIIRTTQWNAEQRPAGVYFAVVSAGDQRISRKVILTK
ncbi:T9SS type A sorting domain-containing protein [bacterium]|nr:T9SS type A sorting domain-containing protein [bacterium]